MHKSALFLVTTCLTLAGLTMLVLWQFAHQSSTLTVPKEGGSSIKLGLPTGQAGLPAVKGSRDQTNFRADSVVLWDTNGHVIRYQQHAFERHPLASITKLMTAMVALDYGINWNTSASIMREEYVQGGQLLLQTGETVTMRDLWHASLLGSANNATLAYVRVLGIPRDQFVQAMNRKAVELGLEQTEFHDVTGLDPQNVSTAYEIARLAEAAFSKYPDIAAATSPVEYTFTVGGSGREHTIRNTNKLISEAGEEATGSKTGFLYEAKYNLVMQGAGEWGNRIAVILGSESEDRNFVDMKELLHLGVP